jgi:uncharacterized protein (TIGR02453 family)
MNGYQGLSHETPRFLADLAANNRRDWFEVHRGEYEEHWLRAGLDLVAALAPVCAAATPVLEAIPKPGGSLRRIHRDTRFAADKSPYAPMLHIALSVGGDRARYRGMHLVVHPDHLGFGAGHYGLSPAELARFRDRVQKADDRAALLDAAAQAEAAGSSWDAPDLKRLPAGLAAAPEWEHLLRRKSVILRGQTTALPDWLFAPECVPRLAALIGAHLPLLTWLLR